MVVSELDPSEPGSGRDLRMFTEWFDVEFHCLVFDLCGYEAMPVDYFETLQRHGSRVWNQAASPGFAGQQALYA